LLPLGLAKLAEGRFVVVNQQHIFHWGIPPPISSSRSKESTIDSSPDLCDIIRVGRFI
jgi:hypothetical protein